MQRSNKQDPTLPQGYTLSFKDRFWAKVNRAGPIPPHAPTLGACWIWIGVINPQTGYGHIHPGFRFAQLTTAHRASWLIHVGQPTQCVLHKCDNRACVNPAHLFEGSKLDNVRDMDAKGRRVNNQPKGEASGKAKLTADAVIAIRHKHSAGTPVAALMSEYGIGQSQVLRIIHLESWAHVK